MQLCNCQASVRLSHSPTQAVAAGLLLWAWQTGDMDRLLPGAQQQQRCSTTCSSKCGQCHVVS